MRERKTVKRIAKSGRVYFYSINRLNELKNPLDVTEKYYRDDEEIKFKLHDKTNEAYLRYVEKKIKIRREYPRTKYMERSEWLEYYKRIIDLIYSDGDFQQWREETKTMVEKEEDAWWENKKQKEGDYDGRTDEYSW